MTDFERMRTLIRQEERYHWAIEKQMAKATKITTDLSQTGGRGTRTGSQVEDGAVLLATLQDEYKEITDALEEARKELREAIGKLRNAKYRLEKTCIRMRYLQGFSIRKIAAALNYNEDYIHRRIHHAEALIINIQRDLEARRNKSEQVG